MTASSSWEPMTRRTRWRPRAPFSLANVAYTLPVERGLLDTITFL